MRGGAFLRKGGGLTESSWAERARGPGGGRTSDPGALRRIRPRVDRASLETVAGAIGTGCGACVSSRERVLRPSLMCGRDLLGQGLGGE